MKEFLIVFEPSGELCTEQTSIIEAESMIDAINDVLFRHIVRKFIKIKEIKEV